MSDKLTTITGMGDILTFDTETQDLTVKTDVMGQQKFTSKEMSRIAKMYRGMNRIYKPFALLFWTDCRNGQASNWNLI